MNASAQASFVVGMRLRVVGAGVGAVLAAGALVLPLAGAGEPKDSASAGPAQQILATTGIRGGLIVHVGCGDGRLTVALRLGRAIWSTGWTATQPMSKQPGNTSSRWANTAR